MEKVFIIVGKTVLGIALLFFFGAVFAYPTKWLVNYVFAPGAIQSVLGTPQIGFWKAWGLSAICSSLFKGINTK